MMMVAPLDPPYDQPMAMTEAGQALAYDLAYLYLWIRGLRYALIILNGLVILMSVYFPLTGNDLFGHPLKIHIVLVYVIAITVDVIALAGIVNSLWFGKLKNHLKISLSYLLSVVILVSCALLATYLVNELSGADILLIVIATVLSASIILVTTAFSFCLWRARRFKKFRKKMGGYAKRR